MQWMEYTKRLSLKFNNYCGFFYRFRLKANDACQVVNQHRLWISIHLYG